MDETLLGKVTEEFARTLTGRRLHRVLQTGPAGIIFDFKRRDGLWLIASIDPANLTLHLSARPDRAEKSDSRSAQRADTSFAMLAKKHIVDARLVEVAKVPGDRIVHLKFQRDEASEPASLVIMLTGRSADAIIIEGNTLVASLRKRSYDLQSLAKAVPISFALSLDDSRNEDEATSNAAEAQRYAESEEKLGFDREQSALRSVVEKRLRKSETLKAKLVADRDRFLASESHQRYGELLLANLHQIRTDGDSFVVVNFYDSAGNDTVIPKAGKADARDAAEHYFKLARRARSGIKAISERLTTVDNEIAHARDQLQRVKDATNLEDLSQAESDRPGLGRRDARAKVGASHLAPDTPARIPGVRRYRTSEGHEILVGRSDTDNDNLTFRIAKSQDLWFHAADYPGSHVVLRNPGRSELPQVAIQKAARFAAKFSHARNDSRVAVNYCEKKFVSKLKRAPAGQVRLSSFKTILVEPGEPAERIY